MKKLFLMLCVAAFLTVACDGGGKAPAPGQERNPDGVHKATPEEIAEAAKLPPGPGR